MTRMVLFALLSLAAVPATADVLIIDEVRQAARMELPTNGLSMDAVEKKFGQPCSSC